MLGQDHLFVSAEKGTYGATDTCSSSGGNGAGLDIGKSCDLFDLFSSAVYHLV